MKQITGMFGIAREVQASKPTSAWTVNLVGMGSVWHQWGVIATPRSDEGDEFEIMIFAIDEDKPAGDIRKQQISHPFNYREQFRGIDEAGAERIAEYIADQLAWGYLPEPTSIQGADDLFAQMIDKALQDDQEERNSLE